MKNSRAVSEVYRAKNIPVFIDAYRYAENAYFIRLREPRYEDQPPLEMARRMFSLVEGCTTSAMEDGMVNAGDFLCTNDDGLFERIK